MNKIQRETLEKRIDLNLGPPVSNGHATKILVFHSVTKIFNITLMQFQHPAHLPTWFCVLCSIPSTFQWKLRICCNVYRQSCTRFWCIKQNAS